MLQIPFQSKLQPIFNIAERNIAFQQLTDEEKRREISYDLLILLLHNDIQPSWGAYWDGYFADAASNTKTPEELQNHLLRLGKNRGVDLFECKVCARGGMMLSQIRLGNHVDPEADKLDSGSEDILDGFTVDEFLDMEHVFEGHDYKFVKLHPFKMNTQARLVNICLNDVEQFELTDVSERYFNEEHLYP
jgi:hypothetical protein